MLVQRRRRCANIDPTLFQSLVFAGMLNDFKIIIFHNQLVL